MNVFLKVRKYVLFYFVPNSTLRNEHLQTKTQFLVFMEGIDQYMSTSLSSQNNISKHQNNRFNIFQIVNLL